MKGKKAIRLARQSMEDERALLSGRPITFRNLTIDWERRTVDVAGHLVEATTEQRYLVIPLLSTEQPLIDRRDR